MNSVVICTQGNLDAVPEPEPGMEFHLDEMNMSNTGEINCWLDIHNNAFSRMWTPDLFQHYVLRNPHLLITNTYFLITGGERIGISSIGVFRRNPQIGLGHYIAVKRDWQGRGAGRYMAVARWNLLRGRGIRIGESETTLNRRESIFLHFSLGFRPKTGMDEWNTPDQSLGIIKKLAWTKLHRIYCRWKRRQ